MRPARQTIGLLGALSVALLATLAMAQSEANLGDHDDGVSPALKAALEAPYLDDAGRRAIRIRHGLWETPDLVGSTELATAALMAGAVGLPVFDDEALPPLLRARALQMRGDDAGALELLRNQTGMTASRVRAEALFALGRHDEAVAAVAPIIDRLTTVQTEDAREIAEGVRALMVRSRVLGSEAQGGADFRHMLELLSRARQELDRLAWEPRVVEAELLYEKHNRAEASAAAREALALNPRSARALAVLGHIAVDAFNFEAAEKIAARLDALASGDGTLEWEGAFSIDAAIIRARARLRQRDPAGAEASLDPLVLAYPDHLIGLAFQAASAAVGFRETSAERTLAAFDGSRPGSPLALFEVGRALAESRQYADAARYLEGAHERLPEWSAPLLELGLLEVQSGRDDRAREWLEKAVVLDPFNTRANNSLTLVTDLAEFDRVESEHFVVRFRPGVDSVMAREMLPTLERIHARVTGAADGGLDHEPEGRTVIELSPDHAWFSVRITGMPKLHTMAASTGPVIAMEAPREGAGQTVGPYDWARVVQHEYTHTVSLSRSRFRLPHWFTEAASVRMEDAPRDERTWRLLANAFTTGTLFGLGEISVKFIRPDTPTDRGQAYAQGHWMYQYIEDVFGASAPLELMDRYAAGDPETVAFERVLGIDADAFYTNFLAWAEDDLRAHGLLPERGEPSARQLVRAARQASDDPDSFVVNDDLIGRLLEEHPEHPGLLDLRARPALQTRGELTPNELDRIGAYARATPVAESPHRALARHWLAHEDGDDRARAIPHLEFLDVRATNTPAYASELARLYAWTGDWAGASSAAERVTTIAPYDAEGRELAARVAIKAGRLADAERHVLALTELEPDREMHDARLGAIRAMIASNSD